ncbi:ATP-binding protein [Winogradskyella sp.]|uniref:ATP-binding protein n=1 Tax=Winogradskyella sp. TaxID=1883156 RepID=UPI0025F5752C|nr:ATP-binding protein [Winogradskyella sp.]
MQLTKTKEKQILKIYDKWMHSYLNGDIETYDSYLDDDYHFIGSTDNEEFLNRKATTNFFKDTAEQFSGKTNLRNETTTLELFRELVFITHVFDAWFLNGNDWTYYARFRFSSVLNEKEEGWRFIYQHFSIADSKADEGETIGFDKVNLENQELREAIRRRTFELEKKNRELEVEGALERIRAQAVAMQQSSDLLDIVVTMRNEFMKLGHEAHYFWHMMWLPEKYEKAMTSGDGTKIGFVMELPRHIHGDIPLLAKWEKSKKPTVVYAMDADAAIDYVDKMVALGNFKNIDPQAPTEDDIRHIDGLTFIMARTSHGEIGYSLPGVVKNPPKEDIDILVKFTGAFDLAHQRFLDLQKAEKQTKETLIELSLERIRSQVMAMQESSDLFNIVVVMRKEFISLGHEADYFWHMRWQKDNYEMSMTSDDGSRIGMIITVPKFIHANIPSLAAWEKGKAPTFVLALDANEAWTYIDAMNTHGHYKLADPNAPTQEDINHIGGLTFIIARTTHGEIGFSLAGKVTDPPKESIETLLHFAKVFDLAYRRFEDLKIAEAQTRETQIELALEKVRSRTIGMQRSDELQETSFLLDEQVRVLGIKTWGCAFNIYGEKDSTEWFGNEAGILPKYTVPRTGIFKEYYQKGQSGESLVIKEFSGKACVDHYEYMSSLAVIGDVLKNLKKTNKGFPTYQLDHVIYFKYGYLLFITKEHVPEAHDVFKRFAKVFEQTYTRFLDLQKAEAQAREAQIEAALEKVRSRSLAMHKPDELQEVVAVVAEKLKDLGVIFDAGGVILCTYFPDNKDVMHWIAADDFSYSGNYLVPYFENPIFDDAWDSKMRGDAYFSQEFSIEVKNNFFTHCFEHSDYKNFPIEFKQHALQAKNHHLSAAWSKNSAIIIPSLTGVIPSENDANIMKRFAKVFEQAYIRFMDLQKVEAQAREAQIEAALEKVRSRTMAMQHSDELPEAANNLFLQVQELGIPAWSAGYCIWEDDKKKSTWCNMCSEGEIQKAFSLPTVGEGYNFEKPLKNGDPFHVSELGGKTLVKHYDFMKTLPGIGEILKEFDEKGIDLPTFQIFHIVYFEYGYVMFITYESVPDAHDIFKRFGQVFNQTYTRFLDLHTKENQATKLAEEKQRLEDTLSDLQATQKQLIQSEKMASLGELTAGIAHEIQNPLNFVNNFSEVSKELLEEMLEEMEKGDMEEVKAIMDDVVQNLEKINHHGNRADGIVKGMLQHSRAGGDKKEPTDINALADEYLRLAYHGLRAKDKSFNSELVTDFDDTIKTIDIIPQDIGRVILNLLTNAFYVVNEKKKSGIKDYNPSVSIATKKKKNTVEIIVTDNGNGMPESVKEKIFQPFFTTKPTGQGTGLGLSMSYDIVTKGHGGQLKVKSNEGKGTIFIIELPL